MGNITYVIVGQAFVLHSQAKCRFLRFAQAALQNMLSSGQSCLCWTAHDWSIRPLLARIWLRHPFFSCLLFPLSWPS